MRNRLPTLSIRQADLESNTASLTTHVTKGKQLPGDNRAVSGVTCLTLSWGLSSAGWKQIEGPRKSQISLGGSFRYNSHTR